jgi:hypothetical protein
MGKEHIDPKYGIACYGPRSYDSPKRHPATVRVGFIGSADTVEKAREWIELNAQGVPGDEKHPAFPGCAADRGFYTKLEYDSSWIEQVSHTELTDVIANRPRKNRFEKALALLEDKLRLLSQKDRVPEYVVLALPDGMREKCEVVDYFTPGLGNVHRDFRRAFKAIAMKYRLPTQLVDQKTMEFRDPDHPSKIAWNFFTGLYFKAGGIPWGPVGLQAGTCHVGISFYRPLGSSSPNVHTSLVQAFDEHGEGLVLRGPDLEWDAVKHQTRSPHLTAEAAAKLAELVLARYQDEMKQTPQRVVVHKSSRWWPEEIEGFRRVLRSRVSRFDLVALQRQNSVRLLPASTYPPLRGTRFIVGEIDYLYTTGFIAELGQFHGLHVPAPIQIADHLGYDTARETLLSEILILTKMNWNAARLGGLFPITLKFSHMVGEIMREIPADREPLPQFKYYM